MKKLKVLLTSFFTMMMVACLSLGITSIATAEVVTPPGKTTAFEVFNGASIRLSEPTGLRFQIKLGETDYEALVSNNAYIGTKSLNAIIVPDSFLTADMSAAQIEALSQKLEYAITADKIFAEGGYYYANIVVTNVKYENLNLKFNAVGYIKDSAATPVPTVYTPINKAAARTVVDIATAAKADTAAGYTPENIKLFDSYIDLGAIRKLTVQLPVNSADTTVANAKILQEIETKYLALSASDKAKVTDYNHYKDCYLKCLSLKNADQIIFSNTSMGVAQMSAGLEEGKSTGVLSYDTAKKYGTESGSTKIKANWVWNAIYKLDFPAIKDVTKYSGIYLYAYTDNANLEMRIGSTGASAKPLAVGEWTRIEITDFTDLNQATGTNLTGAAITVSYQGGTDRVADAEINISGIYGYHFDFVGEVSDLIATLPASAGDINLTHKELLESIKTKYMALKADEKTKVVNFAHYEECFIQYLVVKNNITKVADQIIYSNTAMGVDQMSAIKGTLSYDTAIKHGTDAGSTKLKVVGSPEWTFNYKLDFPYIKDISSYSGIYFYAYTTHANLAIRIGGGNDVAKPLEVGQWTKIELMDFARLQNATATNLTGAEITVQAADLGRVDGKDVYISGIYGTHFNFVGEINDLIASLPASVGDIKSTHKDTLESIKTKYAPLSVSDKAKIVKYGHYVDCYAQCLLVQNNVTKVADQIIYSNTAMGVGQISAINGDISYDTAIKHGSESGSTKLAVGWNKYNFTYKLDFPSIQDISAYSKIYLYVYTTNANLATRIGGAPDTSLVAGEWTRIELSDFTKLQNGTTTSITGVEITTNNIGSAGWVANGAIIYISGIYGEKAI